ncbi:hypothetical protein BSD967_03020 [Bifidobacterium saguini]|uniref:Uncharacterized protein n=2 Tax=Bifidobacterium TaxID=1678 RepID=A0ABX7RY93_9BIFI|nr:MULTISPECIES: hypothetical protein [Bifidobacterium]QSY56980.1 hypothetical protein BLI708_06820 [Bifidobacterium imperatoris]QTB91412.1 hypothetical protein BSD967_03020 [Bifidobacterium saguini]
MKDFFDQARLDLQLQVLRHNREHPYPDTCQFCHSTIQMKPPSDEDVTAREADFDRQTFDITIDGYSKAAEQGKDQQIIILENTDHIDELDFDSTVNLIRFTKNRHQGRYDYLNDVYDITETTPLR